MKHRHGLLLGGVLCITLLSFVSASAVTYDMDGDQNLTAFDIVLKKREYMENPESGALYDMYMIDSHILGFRTLPLEGDEPTEPDDPGFLFEPDPIIEPKHVVRNGDATYYSIGSGSGYFGLNANAKKNGLYICAVNQKDFANPIPAGAYLNVTNKANGKSVNVYVVDVSGQSAGGIDLDKAAFQQVAALSAGRIKISWEIVPYPASGGMKYQLNSGTLQILDHTYPIYSLEKQNADGTFSAVKRNTYGYFQNVKSGANTFRVTDIYGHIVLETVTLVSGGTVQGNENFPA